MAEKVGTPVFNFVVSTLDKVGCQCRGINMKFSLKQQQNRTPC